MADDIVRDDTVVRGDIIVRGSRRTQRKRDTGRSFGKAKRKRFLDALASSCNVKLSARYAQVNHSTVYRHRLRDPQFADAWSEAMTIGFDRLETLVVEHGGAGEPIDGADPDAAEADPAAPAFDFDRALKVLHYNLKKREGRTSTGGGAFRNVRREETNALLVKALAAAKRRVARGSGDGA
jgi:hypothetical protein